MRNLRWHVLCIAVTVVVAFCVLPCGGQELGGGCEYETRYGTITITGISDMVRKNWIRVYFDFVSDRTGDTLSGQRWMFDTSCVATGVLSVGTIVPCLRKYIVSGTCVPLRYEFFGIDSACWLAEDDF
jgi:hypothetical protein